MRTRQAYTSSMALPVAFFCLLLVVSAGGARKPPKFSSTPVQASPWLVSPADGSTVCEGDFLSIHIQMDWSEVPSDGFAIISLNEKLANLPTSSLRLKPLPREQRIETLTQADQGHLHITHDEQLQAGKHRLSVSVLTSSGSSTGVTQTSLFTVSPREACSPTDTEDTRVIGPWSSSCVIDPGRTRAIGHLSAYPRPNCPQRSTDTFSNSPEPSACREAIAQPQSRSLSDTLSPGMGLSRTSVGADASFTIRPVDSDGLPVHSARCGGTPDIFATIVPGPMRHRMELRDDGVFSCTWTPEVVRDVRIDIKVASSDAHISGSPFDVAVGPSYTVDVVRRFAPEPWEHGGRRLHIPRERRMHVQAEADGAPLVAGGSDAEIDALCGASKGACAYATMMTDDCYLVGALALLFSLRRTGCSIPFVAMVTSDGVSGDTVRALEVAGAVVHVVKRMRKSDISDMSEARWNDNYTKLRLWQLPYSKLVFMDSDMLVLQPIRHLFALPEPFAAVPDAFHPCYLNTGFMVMSPSEETFHGLASLVDEVSSEESEQTLVNHWFLDRWRPLSYTYNFAKHSVVSPTRHDIFVDGYMDTVKVVHFLGVKPWRCSRERDCMQHVSYYSGDSNAYIYDLWWTLFDEMCEAGDVVCRPGV